jgi:PUA domain protein
LADITLKNRHHLRKKEGKRILAQLNDQLGTLPALFNKADIEMADADEYKLIIINNEILGFMIDKRPFLTLRGFLAMGDAAKDAKKYITVDSGAVKFVYNGADVMTPGIVEVDLDLKKGDLVWVREEKHGKPLAVGEALMDGLEITKAKGGKAVKSIHHIGDSLWQLEI